MGQSTPLRQDVPCISQLFAVDRSLCGKLPIIYLQILFFRPNRCMLWPRQFTTVLTRLRSAIHYGPNTPTQQLKFPKGNSLLFQFLVSFAPDRKKPADYSIFK